MGDREKKKHAKDETVKETKVKVKQESKINIHGEKKPKPTRTGHHGMGRRDEMDQLDQLKNLLMYSSYRKMLTQRNLRHQNNKLNSQQTRHTKNQAIRKENGDQLKKLCQMRMSRLRRKRVSLEKRKVR